VFYAGAKGEEKIDYIATYLPGSLIAANTSVFYYTGMVRASMSFLPTAALVKTDIFSGSNTALIQNRTQSTFFVGQKGSEISDYTVNYMLDGVTVKSTSTFYYGTSFVRAMMTSPSDRLTRIDDPIIGRMDFDYSNPLSLTVFFKKPTDAVVSKFINVHLGPSLTGEIQIGFGYSGILTQ
jgi:hypothetical protein